MQYIYQISIRLYAIVLLLASWFNPKAKAWINGRKNTPWLNIHTNNRDVIWFHCASLGEFDIGLPLMEKWKENHPHSFILVTFFSPSGMENYHKRNHPADAVTYLPLDTRQNAISFVNHFHPKTVVFVKYEFWAFHLMEAKRFGSKIYSVNTLFRSNQLYFKSYGNFYRKILSSFDHFFVQNKGSVTLLQSIGMSNATISGDLRFDRVFQNKQKVNSNPILQEWLKNERAFIIGSSWPKDEEFLIQLINDPDYNSKVIIAPHEINEGHILAIEKKLKKKSIRYTDAEKEKSTPSSVQVFILNTIGHLTNAFQYGNIAYIGGGMSGKLHNILEPAVFGLPILYGPKHEKFPEADLFIQEGFGFEVSDTETLKTQWKSVNKNQVEIKTNLLEFMKNQVGISEKIITQIEKNI